MPMSSTVLYDTDRQPLVGLATYAASTNGFVASGTAANGVQSLAYLFHSNANTKRVKIRFISVSWSGNGGNNAITFRGNFITAENGAPGGTSQTINTFDQGDAASTLVYRTGATGAPVRIAGDLFSVSAIGGSSDQNSIVLFSQELTNKPLILRASQNEGFEVRSVIGASNLASSVDVAVYYIWTEE